jgi:hypothetical protein
MTRQEIEKYFEGYKWHHFLIYFPAGVVTTEGLIDKRLVELICGLLIFAGGLLQGRFFVNGIKKMLDYIQDELNKTA